MDTTKEESFTDKIINGLKKAAVELEEFRVQAALGKAEAHDAYEEAKKKFRQYLHEAEQRFDKSKTTVKDTVEELKVVFQVLQVQLALGKAETREAFEAQRKKISQALHTLETLLENNKITAEYYEVLHTEIQKFKIKMEILKLRYELNKMSAQEEFEEKKKDFSAKMEDIAKKLKEKEKKAEKTWEHFRDDIAEAYNDMKKSFVG
jgi:flagellar hook-basal body complex protein FliE